MGDVIEILTTATNTVEVEAQGPQGTPGVGVPTGGSALQVLRKKTGTDYDTEWAAAGSGSGSVTSVALASTDLTISGSPITDSGTITANIAANAVTLEKLQTISSEHLLGRHGSGNGGVQQIGLGTGLAISGSNVGVTFGSSAGTACQGNDARLSDSRTPTSHAASHAAAGSDPIEADSLASTNTGSANALLIADGSGGTSWDTAANVFTQEVSPADIGAAAATHSHDASDITSGSFGNISFDGKLGSTSGLPLVTTTAGAVSTLALGAAGTVLTVNSGANGVEFAAASGGGVSAVNSTLADILSVSGSDLVADDLGGDKLYGWDDSAGKAIGFTIGSGLSVSGDTISATASGGSKTYATFTAEHNQPPATAFATLDTRNSIAVLDFDAATDENAVFVGIMPEAASLGSGLIVRLHWMATTATSGNVRWGVQFERSNTNLNADSFDTAVEATAAANGTSGILTTTAITVTTIDGITAGDVFRLKVYRNADDPTNDTMTGDAELVAVEVRSAA